MNKPLYLAGPMSWIPQYNFPYFIKVKAELEANGWSIKSPAELDDPDDLAAALASPDGDPSHRTFKGTKTWADFLARDVKLVTDEVSGIIFLPGWETSKGSRLEGFIALLAGHKLYFYAGDGQVAQADPEEVMATIAQYTVPTRKL